MRDWVLRDYTILARATVEAGYDVQVDGAVYTVPVQQDAKITFRVLAESYQQAMESVLFGYQDEDVEIVDILPNTQKLGDTAGIPKRAVQIAQVAMKHYRPDTGYTLKQNEIIKIL